MSSKTYNAREVKSILKDNGYNFYKYGKGSHHIYMNNRGDSIMIPRSTNKMLVQRELKSHGLI